MTPTPASIATAPTDDAMKERIITAAIMWVYDQTCPNALADLERAVEQYVGTPVSSDS
jgi:hypothetical protein